MKLVDRRSLLISMTPFVSVVPIARVESQAARVRRIGLVVGDDAEGGGAAFKETLRELGYVEGRNLHIETRAGPAAANTINPATELARLDLEVLVVIALPNALAAHVCRVKRSAEGVL